MFRTNTNHVGNIRILLVTSPLSRAFHAFCTGITAPDQKAKLLPNDALSINIADLKNPCKTFEGKSVPVAAWKFTTQQRWASVIMDYDAFNRMSLAEQAPVSSIMGIGGPTQTMTSSTSRLPHLPSKLLKRQRYIKRKAEKREREAVLAEKERMAILAEKQSERKAILAEKQRIEEKLSVLRAAHLEALDYDDDDGGVPLLPSISGLNTTAKISGGSNEAELTALQDGLLAVKATNQQRPTRSRRTRKEPSALLTTSTQLNPSVPSYEPRSMAPIGAACVPPHKQPNLQIPFTTYQPMHTQSVPLSYIFYPAY